MDLVLVSLQFLIVSLFVQDRKVMLCGFWLALIFFMQYVMIGVGSYYFKYAVFDIATLYLVTLLCMGSKRLLLNIVIICSLIMNVYEGLNTYQTFFYPHRDVIQWWMVEVMFIILAWNCNWRGIDYVVKLRRIDN